MHSRFPMISTLGRPRGPEPGRRRRPREAAPSPATHGTRTQRRQHHPYDVVLRADAGPSGPPQQVPPALPLGGTSAAAWTSSCSTSTSTAQTRFGNSNGPAGPGAAARPPCSAERAALRLPARGGIRRSKATWKVIANQVVMMPIKARRPGRASTRGTPGRAIPGTTARGAAEGRSRERASRTSSQSPGTNHAFIDRRRPAPRRARRWRRSSSAARSGSLTEPRGQRDRQESRAGGRPDAPAMPAREHAPTASPPNPWYSETTDYLPPRLRREGRRSQEDRRSRSDVSRSSRHDAAKRLPDVSLRDAGRPTPCARAAARRS